MYGPTGDVHFLAAKSGPLFNPTKLPISRVGEPGPSGFGASGNWTYKEDGRDWNSTRGRVMFSCPSGDWTYKEDGRDWNSTRGRGRTSKALERKK